MLVTFAFPVGSIKLTGLELDARIKGRVFFLTCLVQIEISIT